MGHMHHVLKEDHISELAILFVPFYSPALIIQLVYFLSQPSTRAAAKTPRLRRAVVFKYLTRHWRFEHSFPGPHSKCSRHPLRGQTNKHEGV